jgi:hypothetical protein
MTTYRGWRLELAFDADLVWGYAHEPEGRDGIRFGVEGATVEAVVARVREFVDEDEDARAGQIARSGDQGSRL